MWVLASMQKLPKVGNEVGASLNKFKVATTLGTRLNLKTLKHFIMWILLQLSVKGSNINYDGF